MWLKDVDVNCITWFFQQSHSVPADTYIIDSCEQMPFLCKADATTRLRYAVYISSNSSIHKDTRYLSGILAHENEGHFVYYAADIVSGDIFVGDSLAPRSMSTTSRTAAASMANLAARIRARFGIPSPASPRTFRLCTSSQTSDICGYACAIFEAAFLWRTPRGMFTVRDMSRVEHALTSLVLPSLLSATKELYKTRFTLTTAQSTTTCRRVCGDFRTALDSLSETDAISSETQESRIEVEVSLTSPPSGGEVVNTREVTLAIIRTAVEKPLKSLSFMELAAGLPIPPSASLAAVVEATHIEADSVVLDIGCTGFAHALMAFAATKTFHAALALTVSDNAMFRHVDRVMTAYTRAWQQSWPQFCIARTELLEMRSFSGASVILMTAPQMLADDGSVRHLAGLIEESSDVKTVVFHTATQTARNLLKTYGLLNDSDTAVYREGKTEWFVKRKSAIARPPFSRQSSGLIDSAVETMLSLVHSDAHSGYINMMRDATIRERSNASFTFLDQCIRKAAILKCESDRVDSLRSASKIAGLEAPKRVAILFLAFRGVFFPDLWERWRESDPRVKELISFFVYCDRPDVSSSFVNKYRVPTNTSFTTAWGRDSLVLAHQHALRYVLEKTPESLREHTLVLLVSGDTVPVKPPMQTFAFASSRTAKKPFHWKLDSKGAPGFPSDCVRGHVQWIALRGSPLLEFAKADLEDLQKIQRDFENMYGVPERGKAVPCVPDEYYVGSALQRLGGLFDKEVADASYMDSQWRHGEVSPVEWRSTVQVEKVSVESDLSKKPIFRMMTLKDALDDTRNHPGILFFRKVLHTVDFESLGDPWLLTPSASSGPSGPLPSIGASSLSSPTSAPQSSLSSSSSSSTSQPLSSSNVSSSSTASSTSTSSALSSSVLSRSPSSSPLLTLTLSKSILSTSCSSSSSSSKPSTSSSWTSKSSKSSSKSAFSTLDFSTSLSLSSSLSSTSSCQSSSMCISSSSSSASPSSVSFFPTASILVSDSDDDDNLPNPYAFSFKPRPPTTKPSTASLPQRSPPKGPPKLPQYARPTPAITVKMKVKVLPVTDPANPNHLPVGPHCPRFPSDLVFGFERPSLFWACGQKAVDNTAADQADAKGLVAGQRPIDNDAFLSLLEVSTMFYEKDDKSYADPFKSHAMYFPQSPGEVEFEHLRKALLSYDFVTILQNEGDEWCLYLIDVHMSCDTLIVRVKGKSHWRREASIRTQRILQWFRESLKDLSDLRRDGIMAENVATLDCTNISAEKHVVVAAVASTFYLQARTGISESHLSNMARDDPKAAIDDIAYVIKQGYVQNRLASAAFREHLMARVERMVTVRMYWHAQRPQTLLAFANPDMSFQLETFDVKTDTHIQQLAVQSNRTSDLPQLESEHLAMFMMVFGSFWEADLEKAGIFLMHTQQSDNLLVSGSGSMYKETLSTAVVFRIRHWFNLHQDAAIIWPINTGENHWIVAVVGVRQRKIWAIDSLFSQKGTKAGIMKLQDRLNNWLTNTLCARGRKFQWVHIESFQQSDDIICGDAVSNTIVLTAISLLAEMNSVSPPKPLSACMQSFPSTRLKTALMSNKLLANVNADRLALMNTVMHVASICCPRQQFVGAKDLNCLPHILPWSSPSLPWRWVAIAARSDIEPTLPLPPIQPILASDPLISGLLPCGQSSGFPITSIPPSSSSSSAAAAFLFSASSSSSSCLSSSSSFSSSSSSSSSRSSPVFPSCLQLHSVSGPTTSSSRPSDDKALGTNAREKTSKQTLPQCDDRKPKSDRRDESNDDPGSTHATRHPPSHGVPTNADAAADSSVGQRSRSNCPANASDDPQRSSGATWTDASGAIHWQAEDTFPDSDEPDDSSVDIDDISHFDDSYNEFVPKQSEATSAGVATACRGNAAQPEKQAVTKTSSQSDGTPVSQKPSAVVPCPCTSSEKPTGCTTSSEKLASRIAPSESSGTQADEKKAATIGDSNDVITFSSISSCVKSKKELAFGKWSVFGSLLSRNCLPSLLHRDGICGNDTTFMLERARLLTAFHLADYISTNQLTPEVLQEEVVILGPFRKPSTWNNKSPTGDIYTDIDAVLRDCMRTFHHMFILFQHGNSQKVRLSMCWYAAASRQITFFFPDQQRQHSTDRDVVALEARVRKAAHAELSESSKAPNSGNSAPSAADVVSVKATGSSILYSKNAGIDVPAYDVKPCSQTSFIDISSEFSVCRAVATAIANIHLKLHVNLNEEGSFKDICKLETIPTLKALLEKEAKCDSKEDVDVVQLTGLASQLSASKPSTSLIVPLIHTFKNAIGVQLQSTSQDVPGKEEEPPDGLDEEMNLRSAPEPEVLAVADLKRKEALRYFDLELQSDVEDVLRKREDTDQEEHKTDYDKKLMISNLKIMVDHLADGKKYEHPNKRAGVFPPEHIVEQYTLSMRKLLTPRSVKANRKRAGVPDSSRILFPGNCTTANETSDGTRRRRPSAPSTHAKKSPKKKQTVAREPSDTTDVTQQTLPFDGYTTASETTAAVASDADFLDAEQTITGSERENKKAPEYNVDKHIGYNRDLRKVFCTKCKCKPMKHPTTKQLMPDNCLVRLGSAKIEEMRTLYLNLGSGPKRHDWMKSILANCYHYARPRRGVSSLEIHYQVRGVPMCSAGFMEVFTIEKARLRTCREMLLKDLEQNHFSVTKHGRSGKKFDSLKKKVVVKHLDDYISSITQSHVNEPQTLPQFCTHQFLSEYASVKWRWFCEQRRLPLSQPSSSASANAQASSKNAQPTDEIKAEMAEENEEIVSRHMIREIMKTYFPGCRLPTTGDHAICSKCVFFDTMASTGYPNCTPAEKAAIEKERERHSTLVRGERLQHHSNIRVCRLSNGRSMVLIQDYTVAMPFPHSFPHDKRFERSDCRKRVTFACLATIELSTNTRFLILHPVYGVPGTITKDGNSTVNTLLSALMAMRPEAFEWYEGLVAAQKKAQEASAYVPALAQEASDAAAAVTAADSSTAAAVSFAAAAPKPACGSLTGTGPNVVADGASTAAAKPSISHNKSEGSAKAGDDATVAVRTGSAAHVPGASKPPVAEPMHINEQPAIGVTANASAPDEPADAKKGVKGVVMSKGRSVVVDVKCPVAVGKHGVMKYRPPGCTCQYWVKSMHAQLPSSMDDESKRKPKAKTSKTNTAPEIKINPLPYKPGMFRNLNKLILQFDGGSENVQYTVCAALGYFVHVGLVSEIETYRMMPSHGHSFQDQQHGAARRGYTFSTIFDTVDLIRSVAGAYTNAQTRPQAVLMMSGFDWADFLKDVLLRPKGIRSVLGWRIKGTKAGVRWGFKTQPSQEPDAWCGYVDSASGEDKPKRLIEESDWEQYGIRFVTHFPPGVPKILEPFRLADYSISATESALGHEIFQHFPESQATIRKIIDSGDFGITYLPDPAAIDPRSSRGRGPMMGVPGRVTRAGTSESVDIQILDFSKMPQFTAVLQPENHHRLLNTFEAPKPMRPSQALLLDADVVTSGRKLLPPEELPVAVVGPPGSGWRNACELKTGCILVLESPRPEYGEHGKDEFWLARVTGIGFGKEWKDKPDEAKGEKAAKAWKTYCKDAVENNATKRKLLNRDTVEDIDNINLIIIQVQFFEVHASLPMQTTSRFYLVEEDNYVHMSTVIRILKPGAIVKNNHRQQQGKPLRQFFNLHLQEQAIVKTWVIASHMRKEGENYSERRPLVESKKRITKAKAKDADSKDGGKGKTARRKENPDGVLERAAAEKKVEGKAQRKKTPADSAVADSAKTNPYAAADEAKSQPPAAAALPEAASSAAATATSATVSKMKKKPTRPRKKKASAGVSGKITRGKREDDDDRHSKPSDIADDGDAQQEIVPRQTGMHTRHQTRLRSGASSSAKRKGPNYRESSFDDGGSDSAKSQTSADDGNDSEFEPEKDEDDADNEGEDGVDEEDGEGDEERPDVNDPEGKQPEAEALHSTDADSEAVDALHQSQNSRTQHDSGDDLDEDTPLSQLSKRTVQQGSLLPSKRPSNELAAVTGSVGQKVNEVYTVPRTIARARTVQHPVGSETSLVLHEPTLPSLQLIKHVKPSQAFDMESDQMDLTAARPLTVFADIMKTGTGASARLRPPARPPNVTAAVPAFVSSTKSPLSDVFAIPSTHQVSKTVRRRAIDSATLSSSNASVPDNSMSLSSPEPAAAAAASTLLESTSKHVKASASAHTATCSSRTTDDIVKVSKPVQNAKSEKTSACPDLLDAAPARANTSACPMPSEAPATCTMSMGTSPAVPALSGSPPSRVSRGQGPHVHVDGGGGLRADNRETKGKTKGHLPSPSDPNILGKRPHNITSMGGTKPSAKDKMPSPRKKPRSAGVSVATQDLKTTVEPSTGREQKLLKPKAAEEPRHAAVTDENIARALRSGLCQFQKLLLTEDDARRRILSLYRSICVGSLVILTRERRKGSKRKTTAPSDHIVWLGEVTAMYKLPSNVNHEKLKKYLLPENSITAVDPSWTWNFVHNFVAITVQYWQEQPQNITVRGGEVTVNLENKNDTTTLASRWVQPSPATEGGKVSVGNTYLAAVSAVLRPETRASRDVDGQILSSSCKLPIEVVNQAIAVKGLKKLLKHKRKGDPEMESFMDDGGYETSDGDWDWLNPDAVEEEEDSDG
jgi:hypothetical protein